MKTLQIFFSLLTLATATYDLEVKEYSINITAVNAFPDVNASAFVVFEDARISRLPYGHCTTRKLNPQDNSDFIIEFKQGLTENLIPGYTQYGYLEGDLSSNSAVLLIISRDHENLRYPKHRTIIFPVVEHDSSKIYVYNAVWNKASQDKGIYIYALYKRRNYDGSESESMMLIAADVPVNQGREVAIQPQTKMLLKAFYQPVKTVPEFLDHPDPVATLNWFTVPEGVCSYVVMYGTYMDSATPARMMLIGANTNSAARGILNTAAAIVILMTTVMIIL